MTEAESEIFRLQERIIRLTEHHDSMQAQLDWVKKQTVSMPFTEQELMAIRRFASWAADQCGEDIIGMLLYTGASQLLGEKEDDGAAVVALGWKLEHGMPEKKL